ncbi:MAG: uracil-DNA glycosylase family protein, partial [Pseudomonadota bacterium]
MATGDGTGAESETGAAALRRSVAECNACACAFAATPTAHAPRPVLQIGPGARVCIAGQAPGLQAHEKRRPFDDPSGVRLRRWLELTPETFYDPDRLAILPMAFCFPGHDARGGDLPPPKRCAELWRARLLAAHPRLELIVILGKHALDWHLGRGAYPSLTAAAADWRARL